MNIHNNKVILTKEVSIMDGKEKLFSIPKNTTGTIVKNNMDGTSDIEFNISIEDNLHNLNYTRECKIVKPIPHNFYRKVNFVLLNPLTSFLNGLEDAYDAGDVYITIPQNSIGRIIKDNGDGTCDVEFILKNSGVDGTYELKIIKTLHEVYIMKSLEERWEELKKINANYPLIVYDDPEHPISIMAQPIIKDEEELFDKVFNILKEVGESTEFRFVHTCYKRIWSGELTLEEFKNELKNKIL